MGRDCRLHDWQGFLDRIRGLDRVGQLAAVNREINRVRYREDVDVWGEYDYWAAPGEFFARGGDCEDYAIAKYYSLRELGFSTAKMRVVVLQDVRRARPHAVLVVDLAGQQFMLDNLSNAVVPWETALQYKPYYAVNEEAFWVFRKDLLIGPATGPTGAPPPPTIIIE
jgi:predicted transglutaminase-like cysteine proteinase